MSTESDVSQRPPVRVGRRIFFLVAALVVAVVGFAVARLYYERNAATSRIKEAVADLDTRDPGWKLDDLLAARAEPPAGQNSAEVAVRVAKLVPGSWPAWETDHSRRFEDIPPPQLLDKRCATALEAELKSVAPAVAEARRMATMPSGKHKLNMGANPYDTITRDQQDTRRSFSLLRYAAWDRAQQRDMKGALLDARAGLNAAASLGDEPFGVSQLVRVAGVAVALEGLQRTLALGEASDADLAKVQAALRRELRQPTALLAHRGERAVSHAAFEAMADGRLDIRQAMALSGGPPPGVFSWLGRLLPGVGMNVPRQHLLTLEMQNELVESAATLLPHEQLAVEVAVEAKANALPPSDLVARLTVAGTISGCKAWRRKPAYLRAMDAALAAERYRLKHGKWPEKLDDIPKEYLPAVPLDPYDGKPLRYKRTEFGVVVYALGDNLRDDGGAVAPMPGGGTPTDWGYRLYDADKRRQPTPKAEK